MGVPARTPSTKSLANSKNIVSFSFVERASTINAKKNGNPPTNMAIPKTK